MLLQIGGELENREVPQCHLRLSATIYGYRVDRVDVHDALEEALANALAHANYYGRRGILVVKKGKELSISNPGTIRVTLKLEVGQVVYIPGAVDLQTMELCEYKTGAGARKLLDKMIQNDILRKTGSGPGTKIIFNDDK